MAEVSSLGATWNTTAGSKNVTATPAVNDLIVVVAASSGLAGGTTAVTDDNASGTYTQVDSDRTGFSTTGVLTVWVRTALIPAASSTVFTAAQVGSTGGGLIVLAVKNMRLLGANAVRSNGGESTGTAGTTPAPVLSLLPLALNPIISAVANGSNNAAITPRAGYSENEPTGYASPSTGLSVTWLSSGEKETTITYGATSATAFASVAIELNSEMVKQPAAIFQNPAVFMRSLRQAWRQRRSGILVPDLWTPVPVVG